MADKSTFTAEEWTVILESVMMAGIAVTAADPSGLWGMLKESFASSNALVKGKTDGNANPLVTAIVDDFATSQGRTAARDGLKAKLSGAKPPEMKAKSVETMREASAIVEAKAPGDAPAFNDWLYQISQSVAEAAKEGGFMGIGGVAVSEAETATLAEIAAALKRA